MKAYFQRFFLFLCLVTVITIVLFIGEKIITNCWNLFIAVKLPTLSGFTYYVILMIVISAIFAFRKS